MAALEKSYTFIGFQGLYEVEQGEYSAIQTFNYASKMVHSWIQEKFKGMHIPGYRTSINKNSYAQNVDIYYDFDKKLYCMRTSHTDSKVPNRMWITEAEVLLLEEKVYLAVKNQYTSDEFIRGTSISTPPRFVRQLGFRKTLLDAGESTDALRVIDSAENLEELFYLVCDSKRMFPVIVIAEDDSDRRMMESLYYEDGNYIINGQLLAEDLRYRGHVFYMTHDLLGKWDQMICEDWSRPEGMVRTYYPGFDVDLEEDVRKTRFRYTFPARILRSNYIDLDEKECVAGEAFRKILADNIKMYNMRHRVVWRDQGICFYNDIVRKNRIEAYREGQDQLESIEFYKELVKEMEDALRQEEQENNLLEKEKEELEVSLNKAKNENQRNQHLISILRKRIEEKGADQADEYPYPHDYLRLISWTEENFAGRIELHKRAVRSLRARPDYSDVEMLAKAIEFLGRQYYDMKMGELSQEECRQARLALNIENSQTKSEHASGTQGDEYFVVYNGQKRRLDMHVKGGKSMNSHDARERFRIYYFWDDEENRIVIGSLPDHLHTNQS